MRDYESTVWTLGCIILALHVCNFAYNVGLRLNAGPRVRGALRAMLRRLRNAVVGVLDRVAGALWLLWNLPAICRACAEEGRDEALKAADGGCDVAGRRRVVAEIDRAAMAQEACR